MEKIINRYENMTSEQRTKTAQEMLASDNRITADPIWEKTSTMEAYVSEAEARRESGSDALRGLYIRCANDGERAVCRSIVREYIKTGDATDDETHQAWNAYSIGEPTGMRYL